MSSSPACKVFLTLLVVFFARSSGANGSADPRVPRLRAAQAASKDGVIHVKTVAQFDDFASGKSRPYSLVIFCTANHMQKENTNIKLGELRENFGLMATHYKKKFSASNRLFFLEIELSETKEVFHRLDVMSLPWVGHLAPGNAIKSSGMIAIPSDDRMKPEDYPKVYPWTPQVFADFVKARAHVDMGTVFVPSLLNNPIFVIIAMASVGVLGWQALKIYQSSWFGHPLIWATAVLAVYWFAVSGGMYNIIRGAPLMIPGPNGKVQWYTSQGQLGAEGFTVGSLYLLFAISSSSLVFFPRWFGSGMMTRLSLYVTMAIASFAIIKVVDFFTFKTRYRLRMYLLEGW